MNREETKEAIKVMQAYADGKLIEVMVRRGGAWVDIEGEVPSWDWVHYDYRIKPELTYRPYANTEECFADVLKHGGWVKDKYAIRRVSQITFSEHQGITYDIVQIKGCYGRTYRQLLDDFVWADDGSACGVKEE